MPTEKKKEFIIKATYAFIIVLLIYIGFKYVMYFIMPFILGFGIASIIMPASRSILKKINISKKFINILIMLIFYGIFITLLIFLFMKGIVILRDFVKTLPTLYIEKMEPNINLLLNQVREWLITLDPTLLTTLDNISGNINDSLMRGITTVSGGILNFISSMASGIPSFLISFFFMLISSFFFAVDYQNITEFIMRQFPEKTKERILDIKNYVVNNLLKLIWGYLKIMGITFLELVIGLSILGIENAIKIAFFIAIFDVLPVLGTGGVMIPWVIMAFINGEGKLALGLLILYLIVTVIRNIIEPKIISDTIGLHPILMLMCMFIGAKLLGVLGIVILPIILIVIKNLNDTGKIKLYN